MPRGRRGTLADSEETRKTVLRVAQELFMEHGYRAVSTRQIAEACGLTQPALYHYFSDKQQLYLAMAQEELHKTAASLERIQRRGEGIDERLQQVARYLLSNTRHDHGQMLHDIGNELDQATRLVLSEAFQISMVEPLIAIFAAGIQEGFLKSPTAGGVEPMVATHLFLSMISQFAQNRRKANATFFAQHDVSAQEAASFLVQTLLYGLAR